MSEIGRMAKPTVFIDNERTRVTEWRFAPHAATGWHRHHFDYVVTPMTTGKLKLVGPGAQVTYAELSAGKPYFKQAGVEHDVVNDNEFEFVFVEVEFK